MPEKGLGSTRPAARGYADDSVECDWAAARDSRYSSGCFRRAGPSPSHPRSHIATDRYLNPCEGSTADSRTGNAAAAESSQSLRTGSQCGGSASDR